MGLIFDNGCICPFVEWNDNEMTDLTNCGHMGHIGFDAGSLLLLVEMDGIL